VKVTITFDLDKDLDEARYQEFLKSSDYYHALYDIYQSCRTAVKYGAHECDVCDQKLQVIIDRACESGILEHE